jgi:GrpB-like predicted nucleotidyltransferase (UPF0157 family)
MENEEVELGLAQGLVKLVEPSPRFRVLFEQEGALLTAALRNLGGRVEHCGSTSIPGIPAKPILDMLAGVPAPLDIAALRKVLEPLGYEHATWAGVPGHEVFGKGAPRTHLVHVVPLGGEAWHRMLAFRDTLRENPALAADYARLKRELALRFPDNRAAYTDGKSAFVERVLAR